jgi:hypothetical protein
VAQFDVGPVHSEPASPWFIHWSVPAKGSDIAIELTPAILGTEPLQRIEHGPFSLALDGPTPKLTLARAVWDFAGDTDYRPLVAELWEFLDAAQAAEGTQLVPGCAAALRATIATRMPCTFAETTLLRYGLFRQAGDQPRSYVDLIPGMGFAIDAAVSQFVPSASGPPAGINGYVAAGRTVAELVSTPAGTVVSDPFLAGNTVPAVDPGTGGAGGVLDLQAALSAPHLRLCYPRHLGASSGAGSVELTHNAALLGAGTLAALDAATDAFYRGAPPPAETSGTFVRGRATLTPETTVTLNGAAVRVAVGASLRQVLERLTALPRLAGKPNPSSVKVHRVLPEVLYPGGDIASMGTVSLGRAPAGASSDGWDLPVFGGDELVVSRSFAATGHRR